MQRFRSQDLIAVRWRDAEPWSRGDGVDGAFVPSAYRDSLTRNHIGVSHAALQAFRAHVAEAKSFLRLGFPKLARRFLRFTATRAWERIVRLARWQDVVPQALDDTVARIPSEYAVADLLESLSECELDLGDACGAERALAQLALCRNGAARAAVIRARSLSLAAR